MSFNYIGYWDENYKNGGTSGSGSYGVLAQFKAEVVNALIKQHGVRRVIEFGCGDGHQLGLMHYPEYLGLDVAASSVRMCAEKYSGDASKSFMPYTPGLWHNRGFLQADMTVCLDVLYHITEEADFRATLDDLLTASRHLVVLYTRITDDHEPQVVQTIRDRDLFRYLAAYPQYVLHERIPQRYPDLSSAEFVVLRRLDARGGG